MDSVSPVGVYSLLKFSGMTAQARYYAKELRNALSRAPQGL